MSDNDTQHLANKGAQLMAVPLGGMRKPWLRFYVDNFQIGQSLEVSVNNIHETDRTVDWALFAEA